MYITQTESNQTDGVECVCVCVCVCVWVCCVGVLLAGPFYIWFVWLGFLLCVFSCVPCWPILFTYAAGDDRCRWWRVSMTTYLPSRHRRAPDQQTGVATAKDVNPPLTSHHQLCRPWRGCSRTFSSQKNVLRSWGKKPADVKCQQHLLKIGIIRKLYPETRTQLTVPRNRNTTNTNTASIVSKQR